MPATITLTAVDGSCLLQFGSRQLLFNCSEGFPRCVIEHHVRLAGRLDAICLTSMRWQLTAGLLSLLLKLRSENVNDARIFAPCRLRSWMASFVNIVFLPRSKLHLQELGSDCVLPGFEHADEKARRPKLEAVVLQGCGKAHVPVSYTHWADALHSRFRKRWRKPCAPGCVSYILYTPPVPGKLDVRKAKALGLAPGPGYRDLKNGIAVTLPDGTTIQPDDVLSGGEGCQAVLIMDCPSVEQLPALLASERLAQFGEGGAEAASLFAVVHFAPPEVVTSDGYQAWMAAYCHNAVQHMFLHPRLRPRLFPFLSMTSRLEKLAALAPRSFSLPPVGGYAAAVLPVQPPLPAEHVVDATCMASLTLRPPARAGQLLQPLRESAAAGERKEEAAADGAAAARLTVLGTASRSPSHHRTVSGALLQLRDGQAVIIDPGETSQHALQLMLGSGYHDMLRNCPMFYLSHRHADHSLGLVNLLLQRQQLVGIASDFRPQSQRFVCSSCSEPFAFRSSLRVHEPVDVPEHLRDGSVPKPPALATAADYEAAGHNPWDEVLALLSLTPQPPLIIGPMWVETMLLHMRELQPMAYVFVCAEQLRQESPLDAWLQAQLSTSLRCCRMQHSYPTYAFAMTHDDGWKLSFSGDSRPDAGFTAMAAESTLMLHEATFLDDMGHKAVHDNHSTVTEALTVAADSGSRRALLLHFSQRMEAGVPDLREHPLLADGSLSAAAAFDLLSVRMDELEVLDELPTACAGMSVPYAGVGVAPGWEDESSEVRKKET
eukprot:PLAT12539.18.p1 GENE.PLAT12539.18~~PLAT12539.18.p1  ORF type:complete len:774 (-),score=322.28 PLAT12539.18:232-2553(-)